jgi:hypothetical protein
MAVIKNIGQGIEKETLQWYQHEEWEYTDSQYNIFTGQQQEEKAEGEVIQDKNFKLIRRTALLSTRM